MKSNYTSSQNTIMSKKVPSDGKDGKKDIKDIKDKRKSNGESEKVQINPKVYMSCKKEVNAEIRRLKTEASSQVLMVFDTEEDYEERFVAPMSLSQSLASNTSELSLDEIIHQIPDCDLMSLLKVSPHVEEDSCTPLISNSNKRLTLERCGDLLRISMCFFSYNMLHQFPKSFQSLGLLARTLVLAHKGEDSIKLEPVADAVVVEKNTLSGSAENGVTTATDNHFQEGEISPSGNQLSGELNMVVAENKMEVDGEATPENEEVSLEEVKKETETETEIVSMDAVVTPAEVAEKEAQHAAFLNRDRARADVDLLQLKLAKSLADQLIHIFDADGQAEGVTETTAGSSGAKKKAAGATQQFPLNQLTWPEVARMGLLSGILEDAGRSADDIQTMLRGGKPPNFRTTKSIVRMIRNRLLIRSFRLSATNTSLDATMSSTVYDHLFHGVGSLYQGILDDKLLIMSTLRGTCFNKPESVSQDSVDQAKNADRDDDDNDDDAEMNTIFASEADVTGKVSNLSWNGTLGRCCKVFIKVANLPQAKPFFWEIDSVSYPEYYEVVKQPITLSNIALKLMKGTYIKEAKFEHKVALLFYEDMKRVFMNCITFNTEAITNVAQAHKLLAVLHRHFDSWVWSASRASDITQCHDGCCLLTHTVIQYKADPSILCDVKCGRCSGVFSVDSLTRTDTGADTDNFIIVPTSEQIKQAHEDWFCPLCLREDSVFYPLLPSTDYSLNEWGPSGGRPWVLNPQYSLVTDMTSESTPHYSLYLDALRIFSDSTRSSAVVSTATNISALQVPFGWSIDERVTVLAALCEAMKASTASLEFVTAWWAACERLGQVCSKGAFREADFNEAVERVAGKEGVTFSHLMLDGIDGAEQDKQSVIVGRCCICHRSTFDEDCHGEDVLLCDTCNSEAHLSCTGLAIVTKKEWHCASCTTRLASRESKIKRSFDSLELQRHGDLEESLLEDAIRARAGVTSAARSNDAFKNVECSYCGLTELSLCSPFVIGQSREEHEAHIRLFEMSRVNDFYPGKTDTKVQFIVGGARLKPPAFEAPFFPSIRSKKGKSLLEAVGNSALAPVIVHESCALQMFRARWERDRHSMRRKRGFIAEKVVDMCGLCCKALGSDASGRTYWKFPTSNHLFICSGTSPELEDSLKKDLLIECGLIADSSNDEKIRDGSDNDKQVTWKVISNREQVRAIVGLLGVSSTEQLLRQNLISALLDERFNPPPVSPENASKVNSSSQSSSGGIAENKDDVKVEVSKTAEGTITAHGSESSFQVESNVSATEEGDTADATQARASNRSRELSSKAKSVVAPTSTKPVEEDTIMLKLLPDKGIQVPSEFVIKEETICVDSDDYDLDDIASHKEYFDFARKYFAIALVYASSQKRFRPAKGTMTVTYQIHVEGKVNPLAYTPLSETWTDSIYYFASLSFKRSGNYTVSFLAEGENTAGIEPLIFPVKVHAKSILYGPVAAVRQLNASRYLEAGGRQITLYRRELLRAAEALSNELDAVKSILLMFYAALPFGSLTVVESVTDARTDMVAAFAGSESWNDILDQAWRGAVLSTKSSTELMECVLLLEYSINKAWIHANGLKLMGRLPSPHFAIRCCSFSSVALRVYSLDRAVLYDKVYVPPRGSRGRADTGASTKANITSSSSSSSSYGRQAASHQPRYKEFDESDLPDEDDDDDEDGHGRKRRPAALAAANALQKRKRVDSVDEFNPADWMEERRSSRNRSKVVSYSDPDPEEDLDYEEPQAPVKVASNARIAPSVIAKVATNLYCPVDLEAEMESLRAKKANIVSMTASESVDDGLSPMDAKILLYGLLNKLNNDVDTAAFWAPVDTKLYKDYNKYVKVPMDLGTIAVRLRDDQYEDDLEHFRQVNR